MYLSFQMQECVDKEQKDEGIDRKVVRRRLPTRDFLTNEYLTVFLTDLVCEHIRHISLLA